MADVDMCFARGADVSRDDVEMNMQIAQDAMDCDYVPVYRDAYDENGYRTRSLTFVYEKR